MGNGGSSQPVTASSDEVVHLGHQLFVVLKMNKPDNQPWPLDFVPHVVGSLPIIGGWDEAKAVSELYKDKLSFLLCIQGD